MDNKVENHDISFCKKKKKKSFSISFVEIIRMIIYYKIK